MRSEQFLLTKPFAPRRAIIETDLTGFDVDDVVTIEWTYDPDEVELILVPPVLRAGPSVR